MFHSKYLLNEMNVNAVLFLAHFSICDTSKSMSCDIVSVRNVTFFFHMYTLYVTSQGLTSL